MGAGVVRATYSTRGLSRSAAVALAATLGLSVGACGEEEVPTPAYGSSSYSPGPTAGTGGAAGGAAGDGGAGGGGGR